MTDNPPDFSLDQSLFTTPHSTNTVLSLASLSCHWTYAICSETLVHLYIHCSFVLCLPYSKGLMDGRWRWESAALLPWGGWIPQLFIFRNKTSDISNPREEGVIFTPGFKRFSPRLTGPCTRTRHHDSGNSGLLFIYLWPGNSEHG